MDAFIKKLNTFNDIDYVHGLIEHKWRQQVVMFYDLDKHIIEVGENITIVIKRFAKNGLSAEEIAVRIEVPFHYIKSCLQ